MCHLKPYSFKVNINKDLKDFGNTDQVLVGVSETITVKL